MKEYRIKYLLFFIMCFVVGSCTPKVFIQKTPSEYETKEMALNAKVGRYTYAMALLDYGPPVNSMLYTDSSSSDKPLVIRTCVWNEGNSGVVANTGFINSNAVSVGSVYGSSSRSDSYTQVSQDKIMKMGFANDTMRTFDINRMGYSMEPLIYVKNVTSVEKRNPSDSVLLRST